ncbi:MAG: hypothetical protein WBY67_05550 [Pseudolabrys sp.]
MLTDLMWLVLANLAFLSILLVPAALVWLVHALRSLRATKAGDEMRKLAGGPSVP